MARFRVIATIEAPSPIGSSIPARIARELQKPKYKRFGIYLETIGIERILD